MLRRGLLCLGVGVSSKHKWPVFSHFHRNYFNQITPFSKQNRKSNLNQLKTLLNINSIPFHTLFHTNGPYIIQTYVDSIQFPDNFYTFAFLALLFFFSSFLPSFSSSLLLFSQLVCPNQNPKNEIFLKALFGLIPIWVKCPSFAIWSSNSPLVANQFIHISTLAYNLLIIRPLGLELVSY